MITVSFYGEGDIRIEKPHKSITIRHIQGDAIIKKHTPYAKESETLTLVKNKAVYFEDLDSGTMFFFKGKVPFNVECELS
jgi:hypothetical protein